MYKTTIWITLLLLSVLSTNCIGGTKDKTGSASAPKKSSAQIQKPHSRPAVLDSLRKEHPRLLFTSDDQRRIEKLAKSNKLLAGMIEQLKRNAEKKLSEPTVKYKPKKGRYRYYMLHQGQNCTKRVHTLALAYRFTGDKRFAERARKEMLAAAAFKAWNPAHFLDVAAMVNGMAIGYDWLYDTLSPQDRLTIRKAIVEKGLKPGLAVYARKGGWHTGHNNWNQVCNGGLTLGALAVAEDYPEIAAKVLDHAIRSIPRAMASYSPDGGCYEGPGYWGFGSRYNVLMLAALDSALGKDFGLSKVKGFDKTGFFPIYMLRLGGTRSFNFSDCKPKCLGLSSVLFWMGKKFDQPAYAWFYRQRLAKSASKGKYSGSVQAIIWFDDEGRAPTGNKLARDRLFRGKVDVVTMRSAWNDKNSLFVGFKGGANDLGGHMHMDIGSFVLDADGVQWALDIGPEHYLVPGYWDWRKETGKRWSYFSCNSKSHNTLVIGDKFQRVKNSRSRIIKYLSTPVRVHAVVDMTKAYRGQAKKVLRGIAMLDRSAVFVQDEITSPSGEVRWAMATEAKIKLDGAKATLTQDGKSLRVEILEPAGAKFEIVSPPPPTRKKERSNKGVSMLVFRVKPADKQLRLAVLLTPIGKNWKQLPVPGIKPLSKWGK
ncbi:MAG: DUF4962 domain-containing protein [Phycisphaerae bacterium]|nr:DUF4962 domain-containing protein [Phycisphaerae bacterium]